MKDKVLKLINEQQSPLFRVMSIYNDNEPVRRKFNNNISAFHIGNGYILSVAHNLRSAAGLFQSMCETEFQDDIINNCDAIGKELFNRCYLLDNQNNKRHLNINDQSDVPLLINTLNNSKYDNRWVTFYTKNICKPFLIIQFENNQFYNNADATAVFTTNNTFHEPTLQRYTYLIELELVQAYYAEDIALYKMINTDRIIIDKIPSAKISYEITEIGNSLYCLQGSPSGTNLGRMMNEARIEGILDQHDIQQDIIGGNYIMDGLRYLLKGYFRFGSSGAPYFVYDTESDSFKVNAIQSQASPIQLSIKNDKEGNFQYVNAIASPLSLIRDDLFLKITADTGG